MPPYSSDTIKEMLRCILQWTEQRLQDDGLEQLSIELAEIVESLLNEEEKRHRNIMNMLADSGNG